MVKRISLLITKSTRRGGTQNFFNFQGYQAAMSFAQQMINVFTCGRSLIQCAKLSQETEGLLRDFFRCYNGAITLVTEKASRVHLVINYHFGGRLEKSYFEVLIVAYAPNQKRPICDISATFGIYSDQPTTMTHIFPLSSTPSQ